MSLLLVRGFAGVDDVDADDDGELDPGFAGALVDAVAVLDGAPGDIPYGGVVLTPARLRRLRARRRLAHP